jgi:hypothetical protein
VSQAMTVSHKPSMSLRFVERRVALDRDTAKTVRVLQQMFLPHNWDTHSEEWRDVPLVQE